MSLFSRLADWCVPDAALGYRRFETPWRRFISGPLAGQEFQALGSHAVVPVLTADGLVELVYDYTADGYAVLRPLST